MSQLGLARCLLAAVSLFVAVLFAAGWEARAAEERRVALVLGIGAYEYVPFLANPVNDANAVAAALSGLGFEVTKVVDANLQELREGLRSFGRASADADVALVYYAGHGVQVDGENYIIPRDAEITQARDLPFEALRLSDVRAEFVASAPRVSILILDACRDNPFAGGAASMRGLGTLGLAPIRGARGMLIAFAAAPGEVAADGGDGHSPFTTALLQWIEKPRLEIGLMFRRVRQTVIDLTGGAQTPWVEEALLGEFYFAPEAATAGDLSGHPGGLDLALWETIQKIPSPLERRAGLGQYLRLLPKGRFAGQAQVELVSLAGAGAVAAPVDRDAAVWLSVRGSDDPGLIGDYLARFPEGAFLDEARTRLAALAAQPSDLEPRTATLAVAASNVTEAALQLQDVHRRAVQLALRALGYDAGSADGEFGPRTRAALRAYQAANGEPTSGYLDRPLLQRLVAESSEMRLKSGVAPEERRSFHDLAAIALQRPGGQPTTVAWAFLEGTPSVLANWRGAADAFEAENPGVLIEFRQLTNREFRYDLLAMLGSTDPPDVIVMFGGQQLRALVEAGFVRDIAPDMPEEWAISLKPGALRNFVFDDGIYGVPMRMQLVSFFYNKRLFRDAGVDPATMRTWDGFLAAVRRLKDAGVTPLAAGAGEAWPMQLYWGHLALRTGGESAFVDAYSGKEPGFEAGSFVEAAELLRELGQMQPFAADYLEEDASEAQRTFAQGEAAMILIGSWAIPAIREQWRGGPERAREEFGRVDFPLVRPGQNVVETYGSAEGYAITRNAPPEAVEFLKFLADPSNQRKLAAQGGLIPVVASADDLVSDPLLRESSMQVTSSQYHQLFYNNALGPVTGELFNSLATDLSKGSAEPLPAASAVQASWETTLAE